MLIAPLVLVQPYVCFGYIRFIHQEPCWFAATSDIEQCQPVTTTTTTPVPAVLTFSVNGVLKCGCENQYHGYTLEQLISVRNINQTKNQQVKHVDP